MGDFNFSLKYSSVSNLPSFVFTRIGGGSHYNPFLRNQKWIIINQKLKLRSK